MSKTLDGIITSWNPAAEKMFGYTAGEIIGQPVQKLFPEHLRREEEHIIAQIVAGKRVAHFETLRLRKDGTPSVPHHHRKMRKADIQVPFFSRCHVAAFQL